MKNFFFICLEINVLYKNKNMNNFKTIKQFNIILDI